MDALYFFLFLCSYFPLSLLNFLYNLSSYNPKIEVAICWYCFVLLFTDLFRTMNCFTILKFASKQVSIETLIKSQIWSSLSKNLIYILFFISLFYFVFCTGDGLTDSLRGLSSSNVIFLSFLSIFIFLI